MASPSGWLVCPWSARGRRPWERTTPSSTRPLDRRRSLRPHPTRSRMSSVARPPRRSPSRCWSVRGQPAPNGQGRPRRYHLQQPRHRRRARQRQRCGRRRHHARQHPQPAAGQASIVGTAVRFTPPAGFEGLASFKYTISDTAGEGPPPPFSSRSRPGSRIAHCEPRSRAATAPHRRHDDDPPDRQRHRPRRPEQRIESQLPRLAPGLTTSLGPNGLTVTIKRWHAGTYTVPYTVVDRDGRTAESAITVIVDYPFEQIRRRRTPTPSPSSARRC